MKKINLFILCAMFALALTGCKKSDDPGTDPVYSTKDLILVAYGDARDEQTELLRDKLGVANAISMQDQTEEEIGKAIRQIPDDGVLYVMVDCSVFGEEMPQKAFDDLKTFHQEVNEHTLTNKPLVWVVNVTNPEQALKIFGVDMGTGWYIVMDNPEVPKFVTESNSLEDEDLIVDYMLPMLTAYKNSKYEPGVKSATRADGDAPKELQPFVKNVRYRYWGVGTYDQLLSSNRSCDIVMKGTDQLPSSEEELTKAPGGAFSVDASLKIETFYMPGVPEKFIKVTVEGVGYKIYPNSTQLDLRNSGGLIQWCYLGPLLRSYQVTVIGNSPTSGALSMVSTIPAYDTKNITGFNEVENTHAIFFGGRKIRKDGIGADTEYSYTCNSSTKFSYDMRGMQYYYALPEEIYGSANNRGFGWGFRPEFWKTDASSFYDKNPNKSLDFVEAWYAGDCDFGDKGKRVLENRNIEGGKNIAFWHDNNFRNEGLPEMKKVFKLRDEMLQGSYPKENLLWYPDNRQTILFKVDNDLDNEPINLRVQLALELQASLMRHARAYEHQAHPLYGFGVGIISFDQIESLEDKRWIDNRYAKKQVGYQKEITINFNPKGAEVMDTYQAVN